MCPSPQIEATHGELNVVDHAYQDLLQENQRLHRQGNSYHFRWYQNKSASFNKRFFNQIIVNLLQQADYFWWTPATTPATTKISKSIVK